MTSRPPTGAPRRADVDIHRSLEVAGDAWVAWVKTPYRGLALNDLHVDAVDVEQ
jgi:hypothetical protein